MAECNLFGLKQDLMKKPNAMERSIFVLLALLVILSCASCSSTKRVAVSDQRRGLLMMEGEQIYKNKGFYKSKKSMKHRKKVMKASKRRGRR